MGQGGVTSGLKVIKRSWKVELAACCLNESSSFSEYLECLKEEEELEGVEGGLWGRAEIFS